MRILFTIFILCSYVSSQNIDEKFNTANKLYNSTKYSEGIEIYENILLEGWESSSLYYNLGNAYYRQNQIGQSVWAFKKALKMNPRNKDLIKNLSIVQAKIKDRVILPDEFYFVKIYGKLKSKYILKEWLLLGGIIVFCTVVSFLISQYYFNNNLKIVRALKILMLLILILSINHQCHR